MPRALGPPTRDQTRTPSSTSRIRRAARRDPLDEPAGVGVGVGEPLVEELGERRDELQRLAQVVADESDSGRPSTSSAS
jgi:hypothetical protein